jgi:hypothetical protein
MGYYDVAQICLNGHVINSKARKYPEDNKDYCPKCGEKTITNCPKCGKDIRGAYCAEDAIFVPSSLIYVPPKYCEHCGTPFPWTERKIKKARELLKSLDELPIKDRELFENLLPQLIREESGFEIAAYHTKTLIQKLKPNTADFVKTILSDILSESVKKLIFGS